jgi:L-ascorbate metabolism protein UlaG (beta-lactamase superfamily)
MRIDYIGHACFAVTGGPGERVVFDPYEPGGFGGALRYSAPKVAADLVFVSHGHADHGAVGQVSGSPQVVTAAGPGISGEVSWVGVATSHDDSGGSARGANVVYAVAMGGVKFCHLGDLGHALSPEHLREIGPVDVLFAPVGGHFPIDARGAVAVAGALSPKVLVPMHFKTAKVDFPIAPLDEFLKASPWPTQKKGKSAEFSAGELPAPTAVWVMESSR